MNFPCQVAHSLGIRAGTSVGGFVFCLPQLALISASDAACLMRPALSWTRTVPATFAFKNTDVPAQVHNWPQHIMGKYSRLLKYAKCLWVAFSIFFSLLPTKTKFWKLDNPAKKLLINYFVIMFIVSASKGQVSFVKRLLWYAIGILVAFKWHAMFS